MRTRYRSMPKRTYQPSRVKRNRTHGFRARKRAGTGVLSQRRRKGRKRLAVHAS